MDKKKIELIITGVLILVFVMALGNSFKKIVPKFWAAKPKPAAGTLSVQQVEALFKKKQDTKKDLVNKDLQWGRDPFILQETEPVVGETVVSLKLMGITAGGKAKPKAIINNEIVMVGSKVGKFTILKILKDRVMVSDGKDTFEVMLNL